MKNKKITITVSGPVKSGKSIITYIIKEMLKVHDLEVKFNPNPDFLSENKFNQVMRNEFDEAIKTIGKNTKIVIKEIQENINF
jgi:hypothetical protein